MSAFQGSIACTRIDFDKGVCGHCYTTREIVIVPNVEEFPGHIACSSASKSEIVLPIFDKSGEVFGVLDVDSDKFDDFSETDAEGLRKIVEIIENLIVKFCSLMRTIAEIKFPAKGAKLYKEKKTMMRKFATPEGTKRFAERFPDSASGHFREAQGFDGFVNRNRNISRKIRRGRPTKVTSKRSRNLSNRAET